MIGFGAVSSQQAVGRAQVSTRTPGTGDAVVVKGGHGEDGENHGGYGGRQESFHGFNHFTFVGYSSKDGDQHS